MDWLIFAFLSPVLWAGVNVIDKFLLSKKFKDPYSYLLLIILMDPIALILFSIFFPISFSYPGFMIGIILGFLHAISIILYNKAMLMEEASIVISLSYLNVLFTLPLAYIFLKEVLILWKYFGIIFLFIGAFLISYKKIKSKWVFSPAIKIILIAAFIWTCMSILEKYSLNFIDSFSLFFWLRIGLIIGGSTILINPKIRNDFLNTIKRIDRNVVLLSILGLLLAYLSFNLFFLAISTGYISLVVGITSIQPFMVFLYTTGLSFFLPQIMKERIDRLTVLLKLMAIFFIFIGSWLVVT